MSRFFSTLLGLSVLVAGFAGCNWDLDLDGVFSPPPGLEYVPKRFALGAKVKTGIEAAGPDAAVWADNSDVIRVERVSSTLVELHAVGAGATRMPTTSFSGTAPKTMTSSSPATLTSITCRPFSTTRQRESK